ncbi:SpoIIE family protein phosphatase [bacterium]|nr:SpoIIE family protein phosphatase [candidate division CSSED10-310 bacterium]
MDLYIAAVLGLAFFSLIEAAVLWNWTGSVQNLLAILGTACVIYVVTFLESRIERVGLAGSLPMTAGFLMVTAEVLRIRVPQFLLVDWISVGVGIPAAVFCGWSIFRSIQADRSLTGKVWFGVVCLVAALTGNPHSGILTFLLLVSQLPLLWIRKLSSGQVYRAAAGSFGLLLLLHLFAVPGLTFDSVPHFSWSFVPVMIYSLGFNLVRAAAWALILFALMLPFKPRRIRSRLRWAFLLNFLVPTSLLLMMSLTSLIFLIGGYQAATAKRLLFQIGTQARDQAFRLYETAHGISREAPGPSPFYRVGAVKFADGSVQEWSDPPVLILEKLENGNAYDIEFLLVEEPDWELWIAGFYRMANGSGATIAYRIDRTVLEYTREIIGLDLKLTPGLDWSFLPFTQSRSPRNRILTYSIDEEPRVFRMPIGAILITSFQDQLPEDHSRFAPKPYATIEVIASRETMAQSLVKTNALKKLIATIKLDDNVFIQDSEPMPSAELQSVNILNLAVFAFLSITGGLLTGLILLSLIISHLISRKISNGLSVIKRGTTHLKSGDLDYRIPVISQDELGELAADFNAMASNLKSFQTERERYLVEKLKQDRLQNEFETARMIQNSLLPVTDPTHRILEVTGVCRSAEEVGGDYFDYFNLPDDAFGIAIGDVSGHGMGAGLLMSMAKSCLLNQIRVSPAIPEVIGSLNAMVCDSMKQKMLMTFLYAVFSPGGDAFSFASAGHHFPYVYCRELDRLDEPESIAYPLGVRRNIQVQIRTRKLHPGDLIVFYTDGIIETINPGGELFGFHRFERLIRSLADQPVHLIRKTIFDELERFRKNQPMLDDVTLVLVRIKPS